MGFYQRMKEDRERKAAMGLRPTYKILQIDQLKKTDLERAMAIASFVKTEADAEKLAGHEGLKYKGLDVRGQVGVICYKDVQIVALFKREVVETEPGPAEPVPECVLKEPEDAWIQIPLLRDDAAMKQKGIGDRLRQALQQVERLRSLWTSEETERKRLEDQLEKGKKDREELKGLREKVILLEEQIKATAKDVNYANVQLQKEKRERREDRIRIIEEMFPVFNTVWLAGKYKVGDQLYGMLRKQATEALGKVGIDLVEPTVGDEFDPQLHHAVHSHQFPTGAREVGTITQVNKVGWKLATGEVVEAAEVAVGVEGGDSVAAS